MSNLKCCHLLSPYVREVFLTKKFLQAARLAARFKIFGDPVVNATYAEGMIREATANGHEVQSITKTAEVMAMLETIVVKEKAE